MDPRARTRQKGFTLAEMLVVIAILGILAAIAAPNMSSMVRTQRVRTAAFDIYAALNLARSEAIKRNRTVTITPTGGDWAKGWEAKDSANNVVSNQSGWDTLVMTGPASITFNSAGRLSAVVQDISITSPDLPMTSARCIMMDLSGRAVSKEGPCA